MIRSIWCDSSKAVCSGFAAEAYGRSCIAGTSRIIEEKVTPVHTSDVTPSGVYLYFLSYVCSENYLVCSAVDAHQIYAFCRERYITSVAFVYSLA